MNIVIFFLELFIPFLLVYIFIQLRRRSRNEKIKSKVQTTITKEYDNIKGRIVLYPFFDSKFNQKISPEEYDFLFCSFGLIVLAKHYKPILTLSNQTRDFFQDLKINNCNYINHKIDNLTNEFELEVSGFGVVTRIRIIVRLESNETLEEINRLIENLKTNSISPAILRMYK
jgi:hypothetical protein